LFIIALFSAAPCSYHDVTAKHTEKHTSSKFCKPCLHWQLCQYEGQIWWFGNSPCHQGLLWYMFRYGFVLTFRIISEQVKVMFLGGGGKQLCTIYTSW